MGPKGSERPPVQLSRRTACRLAVTKQRLAGAVPRTPGRAAILSTVRDIAYVQIDPIPVVAPAHYLTLWSRLGSYRRADLDRLLWKERRLFEYVAHAAAYVLSDDYPLFHSLMQRYPRSLSSAWGSWRAQALRWIPRHAPLRAAVLRELADGPRVLGDFAGHVRDRRPTGGWGSGSDVEAMLFHLMMAGQAMIVGREGNQNLWGLAERYLPEWVDRKTELSPSEVDRAAAERSIRALGTAAPKEVRFYFVRGMYHDLPGALSSLEAEGTIHRVEVAGLGRREVRYIHDQDLALLPALEGDGWRPRMSLLSPFDNLICERGAVRKLFGFDYAVEIYVPAPKRRFGYYVLPILWGDRFIGRLDPSYDRGSRTLRVLSVHAEPAAPDDVGEEIATTIGQLGAFLGAARVEYPRRVPRPWRRALRGVVPVP